MIKIKPHRLARRMTQAKLAEAVGVEQGYISRLERGLQEPSADVLRRLAAALKVSRADLYERDGLEARIFAAFENIPADRLEEALELLENLSKALAKR
jgi:transcriptional regulator with XRE-family HTH domain